MKFLDANVIAYAFYQNKHQDACQEILRNGGLTDTIVLVEAFNIIELETNRSVALRVIRALLKSNITVIDSNVNVIFETLKRAEKYHRLKFIDLTHYTVALIRGCESVMSYDKDFDGLEIPRRETA